MKRSGIPVQCSRLFGLAVSIGPLLFGASGVNYVHTDRSKIIPQFIKYEIQACLNKSVQSILGPPLSRSNHL